jgi:hypothetical protein
MRHGALIKIHPATYVVEAPAKTYGVDAAANGPDWEADFTKNAAAQGTVAGARESHQIGCRAHDEIDGLAIAHTS